MILLLTLELDPESFDFFNRLRIQYFPKERNKIPAHLTLFHQLDEEKIADVEGAIEGFSSTEPAFTIEAQPFSLLGKSIVISKIESESLTALHQKLSRRLKEFLIAQDLQKFFPHITIQNKVDSHTAAECLRAVAPLIPAARTIQVNALLLWEYIKALGSYEGVLLSATDNGSAKDC